MRIYRREISLPYKMWLYPLPALIPLTGWIFVAITPDQRQYLGTAMILFFVGLGLYFLRARVMKLWPLEGSSG